MRIIYSAFIIAWLSQNVLGSMMNYQVESPEALKAHSKVLRIQTETHDGLLRVYLYVTPPETKSISACRLIILDDAGKIEAVVELKESSTLPTRFQATLAPEFAQRAYLDLILENSSPDLPSVGDQYMVFLKGFIDE